MQKDFWEKLYWLTGWVYDFSKIATILLFLVLFVHYFLFTILIVSGKSMEPNFNNNDVAVVDKISYMITNPDRGDVVAMYFPGETSKRFIKRVIAVPDDTVQIVDGKVYINGRIVKESYLPKSTATLPDMEQKLSDSEYFVMGDNRDNSSDSRAWGPVPRSFIVGHVISVIYSLK